MHPVKDVADRFPFVPYENRPKLEWPGGARVALWVLPNIEHYEYMPTFNNVRKPWPRMPAPDVLGYGVRDYGNRVGVWRMFDVFDKHNIKCTVSLNFGIIEHYPDIWEAMEARDYDYVCHGLYNSRYMWNLDEAETHAVIKDCVDTYRKYSGRQLNGWFGPAASGTYWGAEACAANGISFSTDFYHDDQPMRVKTAKGDLVSIPYSMDVNDAVVYRWQTEGEEFARMMRDYFDVMYAEGEHSGTVMPLCLHPYLYGQPHRLKYLDETLAYIMSHDGVWQATGTEIADWCKTNWLPKLEGIGG
jgi:allantoinase